MDPILALIGVSEYQFFKFMRVKEPYVKKLLVRRAIWILTCTIVVSAALVCLFAFVPGKRL